MNKPAFAIFDELLQFLQNVTSRLLRQGIGQIHQPTHADTCCLGRNFVVLHSTYRTADVYAYNAGIKPIENVMIVSGATAYDDAATGTTYILVFNEALYYGENSTTH
jgi:hypothetical protein